MKKTYVAHEKLAGAAGGEKGGGELLECGCEVVMTEVNGSLTQIKRV